VNNPVVYEGTFFQKIQFDDGLAMAHLFANYPTIVCDFWGCSGYREHGRKNGTTDVD
jgi:hypothetical protein